MKSASTVILILQLLLCPALNAANVQMAPVAVSPVCAPLAVGSALTQMGAGSMSLGSQSLGAGKLSLSAAAALSAPEVRASMTAAPAEALRTAAAIISALPPAALPVLSALAPAAPAPLGMAQAAAGQAPVSQTGSLGSLQAAAEPAKPGQSKELAAAALFDGSQKAEPKEWTFMVFLNGHNDLDDFGEVNIKQMEKVGSNDRVNIVVQWASLGKPTKRMLIQRSETGEVSSPVIEELPAVDMGSADQLSEFIAWTVEHFPASHYMVDLWDHGAGWHLERIPRRARY